MFGHPARDTFDLVTQNCRLLYNDSNGSVVLRYGPLLQRCQKHENDRECFLNPCIVVAQVVISVFYSGHDSDILLTLRRLGPNSDHDKKLASSIAHSALHNVLCCMVAEQLKLVLVNEW